jgi:pyruvate/2-oxoglutarate dehydrogenase complex dihydrolipoamide dehydrogenase (E3) component
MNSKKICVIGAGCSGITAVKNLVQAGIKDITCYEKGNQIGGNWVFTATEGHSSVCETTHIISSKTLSQYIDFPMPDDYPDYPSHHQVLNYFQSYAKHFAIYPYIRFNTEVKKVTRLEDHRWEVEIHDGSSQVFDYLMICSGHHAIPNFPTWKDDFEGEMIHSHSFKNNLGYEGKKVLVIGAGNSACDCACEISRVAATVSLSIRTPQYIIPKFIFGKPADTLNKGVLFFPKSIRNLLLNLVLKMTIGNYKDYQLENPKFPVTKAHPTMNSELLYKIRHGKVQPKKGVASVSGKKVTFTDGSSETFDVIVAATGYKMAFRYFDKKVLCFEDAERIELYLRMIHPTYHNLFFIGLVQPQGCIWPIADHQSKLIANHIMGRWELPKNIETLAKDEADEIAKDFLNRARHSVEVHFHEFIHKIKKNIPKNSPEWIG